MSTVNTKFHERGVSGNAPQQPQKAKFERKEGKWFEMAALIEKNRCRKILSNPLTVELDARKENRRAQMHRARLFRRDVDNQSPRETTVPQIEVNLTLDRKENCTAHKGLWGTE